MREDRITNRFVTTPGREGEEELGLVRRKFLIGILSVLGRETEEEEEEEEQKEEGKNKFFRDKSKGRPSPLPSSHPAQKKRQFRRWCR